MNRSTLPTNNSSTEGMTMFTTTNTHTDSATVPHDDAPARDGDAPTEPETANQVAVSRQFAKASKDRLLYDVDGERWLYYDGLRWNARNGYPRALRGMEPVAARAGIRRVGLIRSIVDYATNEESLRVGSDRLDREPELVGVANGVVNLRTGELLRNRPDLLITKSTGIAYELTATCDRWRQFLEEVLGDDPDIQEYVQRWAGYLLTGHTSVQKLWILHGDGSNGKSVFVRTLQMLLGDYAQQAPNSVLVAGTRSGGASNDIARIAGARFVAVSETDRRDTFSEAQVKKLIGGDRVEARFLFREFVEFDPEAKFALVTNYLPSVRGGDHGIWRRLVVVPFARKITNPDPMLVTKLRHELPGILAWAVEGARAFLNEGLPTEPAGFRHASDSYRAAQDIIGEFLREQCVVGGAGRTEALALRAAFEAWCSERDLPHIDWQSRVAPYLQERGIESRKYGKANRAHWFGIELRSDDGRSGDQEPRAEHLDVDLAA
jgi:P4 family phage/plasmid primase-like protien